MPHLAVQFGALPIGARFSVAEKQRVPADRRTFEWVRVHFYKRTHGSLAGFASRAGMRAAGDRRFEHGFHVQIDTDDLRLVIACLQNSEARPCE